ncbi:MAG TPA: hypothetical protein VNU72_04750, partial [Puia sp.]|nr:hypothetical protein [Puia sp.]
MRSTPKILISLQRPGSILLALLLLALTIGASYWIAQAAFSSAFLLILGVIGLGVGIFMIVYPEFGFYISIAASFFIFTVLRLFNTDLPLVSLVDVLVWITFAGVLIRKGIRRESIWKNCDSPIVFMYMVFLIYNILEYFNPDGGSKELYFLFFRRTITLILFLYCSIQLFDDMKSMKRFFKISLLLLLVSGLYACYEEWFGLPRFELNFILADPLREKLASLDGGGNYRKSSFLGSCTDFG